MDQVRNKCLVNNFHYWGEEERNTLLKESGDGPEAPRKVGLKYLGGKKGHLGGKRVA